MQRTVFCINIISKINNINSQLDKYNAPHPVFDHIRALTLTQTKGNLVIHIPGYKIRTLESFLIPQHPSESQESFL